MLYKRNRKFYYVFVNFKVDLHIVHNVHGLLEAKTYSKFETKYLRNEFHGIGQCIEYFLLYF